MGVSLSPGQVISHILVGGVTHDPSVKYRGRSQQISTKKLGPVNNVISRESAREDGQQFVYSSIVQVGLLFQHEAVFVALAKAENYFRKFFHDSFCGRIHQV